MNTIVDCGKCKLSTNQNPLFDTLIMAEVMWVGLSAKVTSGAKQKAPIGGDTNTGKIISNIESELQNVNFYKTNSVKCPPLDNHKKLRYPTEAEMEICYKNLVTEIQIVKPILVMLLGEKVSSFMLKKEGIHEKIEFNNYNYKSYATSDIIYVPVHHPSYIRIYKFKDLPIYKQGIINAIVKKLNSRTTCLDHGIKHDKQAIVSARLTCNKQDETRRRYHAVPSL